MALPPEKWRAGVITAGAERYTAEIVGTMTFKNGLKRKHTIEVGGSEGEPIKDYKTMLEVQMEVLQIYRNGDCLPPMEE